MKSIYGILTVVALCLGAGCASAPPVQMQNGQQLEMHGLTLSVYPVANRSEVKQIFKVNLLDRGVLPVKLKAENHNASASFIIARDKVVVMNETTRTTNAPGQVAKDFATWSQGKKVGTKLAVGAATGSPVIFLAIAMSPTPSEFVFKWDEEKLTGKEFVTRTLGPGQAAEGYIYFRYTKPVTEGAYHVVSDVTDLTTGESLPFDFKLDLNLNNL